MSWGVPSKYLSRKFSGGVRRWDVFGGIPYLENTRGYNFISCPEGRCGLWGPALKEIRGGGSWDQNGVSREKRTGCQEGWKYDKKVVNTGGRWWIWQGRMKARRRYHSNSIYCPVEQRLLGSCRKLVNPFFRIGGINPPPITGLVSVEGETKKLSF